MNTTPTPVRARRTTAATGVLLVVLALLAVPGAPAGSAEPDAPSTAARAAVTQQPQPARGPGGSETPFGGVQITAGGTGDDAWYVAEPVAPRPAHAPLVVVMHGFFEFEGHANLGAWMAHTARQGNVVIYPRWQTSPVAPCQGPFRIAPCERSAVNGIKGALAFLAARPARVRPRLDQTSYVAHSFGAVVTLNMTNKWRHYGIPRPTSLWLDEPDDSGLSGTAEGAVDDDLTGIPATTKIVCLAGADGTTSPTQHVNLVLGYRSRACNVVFPMLGHVPAANKALVMSFPDDHGSPGLTAPHGVCAGDVGEADTYDWGLCWRSADALRACALHGADCDRALGNTARNRYVGTWSDGTPVVGLKVQGVAPITRDVVPARQSAPRTRFAAPRARLVGLRSSYAVGRAPRALRGRAASAHGVAFVAATVVRRTGGRCAQLTTSGRFQRLGRCARPTSSLWADGQDRWRLALTRLPRGRYVVRVRVVDSYGRTHGDAGSTARFRVG